MITIIMIIQHNLTTIIQHFFLFTMHSLHHHASPCVSLNIGPERRRWRVPRIPAAGGVLEARPADLGRSCRLGAGHRRRSQRWVLGRGGG